MLEIKNTIRNAECLDELIRGLDLLEERIFELVDMLIELPKLKHKRKMVE
jgi:hypothetical protein